MNTTYIRMENIPDALMSEDFGPFEYAQLTYSELRVSPDGESFAFYRNGYWYLVNDETATPYTDVVIWGE